MPSVYRRVEIQISDTTKYENGRFSDPNNWYSVQLGELQQDKTLLVADTYTLPQWVNLDEVS